ncbi:single-stranded DNA-binding protein [Clostridium sp. BJN0001]|uniref:single-stranded DNA-binding protein n=1 Tax=Clostridium sp. BJN0001 TaxID=2930219 RepID=UPI001FD065A0|nr:single-stranded DNA-binding protein [Clostridium sp. BJN0001]
MNKVVLIGRLTKDPELKFTPGTGAAVTTLTLAVDRYNSKTNQREADFIPVVIWGKQAENVANYMSKGSQMGVTGRIQTRSYDAKDGTKRYVTEVVADPYAGIEFLGSKHSNSSQDGFSNNDNNGYSSSPNKGKDPFGGDNFEEDMTPVDDGDMPF